MEEEWIPIVCDSAWAWTTHGRIQTLPLGNMETVSRQARWDWEWCSSIVQCSCWLWRKGGWRKAYVCWAISSYLSYINFEESSGDPARVQILYDKAITEFPVANDLWLSYTQYLDSNSKVPSIIKSVYFRAVWNCPWVEALWAKYMLALERFDASEEDLSAVSSHSHAYLIYANSLFISVNSLFSCSFIDSTSYNHIWSSPNSHTILHFFSFKSC